MQYDGCVQKYKCIIVMKVVSSNPIHGEVYLIQHYVIKFVSGLRFASTYKAHYFNHYLHMNVGYVSCELLEKPHLTKIHGWLQVIFNPIQIFKYTDLIVFEEKIYNKIV
jgi:hypothetical protein